MFSRYQIYPYETFTDTSPLRVFQQMYPDNYYSQQAEELIKKQDYEPTRRGADLPWWGKEFFSTSTGRIMIISQDSLSSDAGSIVFFAHLFPVCGSESEYSCYCRLLGENYSFRYSSWFKVKRLISEWGLNPDKIYITDAAKVYRAGSWKDRDFDKEKSRRLLLEEINLCAPDVIIILGAAGISLLCSELKYGEIIDRGRPILISGIETIVAPFPIGNGPTQKNFSERMRLASQLIRKTTMSIT